MTLLDKDANVHVKDINGLTPLLCACKNGHLDMVNALLDKDSDVNIKCSTKWASTPLHYACWNSHTNVALSALKNYIKVVHCTTFI